MVEKIHTPTCEVTGLPLPILPSEPQYRGAFSIPGAQDRHHHFHPERSPTLDSVGGQAVRNSRIQKVPYGLHHHGYHKIFSGPELPDDEDEMFRLSVLAAARVVPRQGIKIYDNLEWETVEIDDKTHNEITKKTTIDQRNIIAKFFSTYAVNQGLKGIIDEKQIDEFLDQRTKGSRKHEIARLMIKESLGISIESLDLAKKHNELKEQGLIAAKKPKTLRWVANKIVRTRHVGYFSSLAYEELAAY